MKRIHHPEFVREYEQFREHYEWFNQRSKAGDLSIPATKEAVAEMREFVDRWAGRSGLAEMDEGLRKFGGNVAGLEKTLERDAAEKLLAVLEKHGDVIIGKMLHKQSVAFIELMKNAPEQLRPELLKVHREHMGKDFDPETFFRDSEEDAEENRREFEQAWQTFAADRPDRATPELRVRVLATEGAALGAWKGELLAKMNENTESLGSGPEDLGNDE